MDNKKETNRAEEISNEYQNVKNYEQSKKEAKKIINNFDELEAFLKKIEEKLEEFPKVRKILNDIPLMISMVRSYIKGEYKEFPLRTVVGIVAALIYFISPVDFIPDAIPGIGIVDDALVIAVTMSFIEEDVEK